MFGNKWKYILPYLGAAPEYADLVVISDELALKQEIADKKTMRLSTFASNVAGYRERCEAGWFHINEWRKRILQEPETTLGILIRGTDYVAVRPKGHAVQGTPEQIIDKIKELSKEEWCFKNIFVATEDADILMKMQKDSWKSGDGWKYGADYLCAMVLLSKCGSFIASGRCTGTDLVQKLANGRHNRSYIFDLGAYE